MDWNHQKIPYYSIPPVVHPSLIPSTVAGTEAQIAPGAETVGQAQILTEFSKPFELQGFFGAADAGAFGGDAGAEAMMAEESEEAEIEGMDEDGCVCLLSSSSRSYSELCCIVSKWNLTI